MGHSDRRLGVPADVASLLGRAEAHRADALLPLATGRGAPCRLCAKHALELYLGAYLASRDVAPAGRGLAARLRQATAAGLPMRPRTQAYLEALAEGREEVAAREAAERAEGPAGNRLAAALDEIAARVAQAIG